MTTKLYNLLKNNKGLLEMPTQDEQMKLVPKVQDGTLQNPHLVYKALNGIRRLETQEDADKLYNLILNLYLNDIDHEEIRKSGNRLFDYFDTHK